jgi:hypothetical protein
MCLEKLFNPNKQELADLKYDMRIMSNQSLYLSRKVVERPLSIQPKTLIAKDTVANLEIASTLITPNAYTPPEGMLYRSTGTDASKVLDKYKLEDHWLRLDSLYRFPRWDYMQLLILWDWTDKKTYVAEWEDCDKFARIFQTHLIEFAKINGTMLVIDYSGSHSYNLLFDMKLKEGSTDPQNPVIDVAKSKLIVFEPQSDEWEEVPILTAEPYVPSFPKWQAMREVAGLKKDMYPLKDCYLVM